MSARRRGRNRSLLARLTLLCQIRDAVRAGRVPYFGPLAWMREV